MDVWLRCFFARVRLSPIPGRAEDWHPQLSVFHAEAGVASFYETERFDQRHSCAESEGPANDRITAANLLELGKYTQH